MPHLNPKDQFEDLKKKISGTLADQFPIQGRGYELTLNEVDIKDNLEIDDIRSQAKALKTGKTWAVPVYGDISLKKDGKELDRKRVLLLHLPKTTDRFGYIIKGSEYQTLNQLRMKSGVYHRRAANDVLSAEFNLANRDQFANGKSFKIEMDPDTAIFTLKHKTSNIPLYHLIKSTGISDKELEIVWGKKILEANKNKGSLKSVLGRFYKAVEGKKAENPEEHINMLSELLQKTELLEETTEKTLGKGHKTVTGDTILSATQNLLGISRGDRDEDDRHAMEFQTIHSVEDLIDGRLRSAGTGIRRKILYNLGKQKNIKRIVPVNAYDKAVTQYFRGQLVVQPEQTNPLEMVAGQMKTTIMGEQGGIKSPYAVLDDAKLINPSHLGFLDPVHTPEGERTGISLALPLGTTKRGNELLATYTSIKTGKRVKLKAGQVSKSVIAFPDQYDHRKGKKPKPKSGKIKAVRDGEVVYVSPKEVDYVLPSPRAVFGIASNMIPFLQNNQGNRAMTAAKQQEQAVPLVHREAPLVQVQGDRDVTFEEIMGRYASRKSPVDGVVEMVKKDAIIIREGKKKHEVQIYRDFALQGHTLYDSDVKVKAGDKVKKGELIADSTFTKDGVLALGTNLRTAYMPFMGYNFDDGIVISEAAALKLASMHIYKKDALVDADTVLDRKKFVSQHPHVFNRKQVEKIADSGVVKIGQEIHEGDPIILALRRPTQTKLMQQVRMFRRGRPDKLRDASVVWDKPYSGIVTDVVRKGKKHVVYIKTKEPAQIGDKVVGRHGNKGVITRIVSQSEMPYSEDENGDKQHIDIALNPLGVPGRINVGQVLETAAGKIAHKRGTPYKVRNFEAGKDYLASIKKELADAGLTDKEALINPRTGKPFKQDILVGNQYILKLKHQVGKKISARSGGFAMPYDVNHAPAGGSPHGGQSMGELGTYAMLAHGSRANLHEMYAYKSSKNDELWNALREGTPLPPPKVPFAYKKFLGYLNAMRVDVRKNGNSLQLVPFTEKQILSMSKGALKDPGLVVRGKDLRPEVGGLFDEKLTGGREGTRWTHFTLSEPMPNPLFETAIKKLTKMTDKEYRAVIRGDKKVNGKTGGAAIEQMLKAIDVNKRHDIVAAKIKKSKGAGRNALHKELRILRALKEQKQDPTVYMMRSVPVIPPIFRPVTVKEDGALSGDDLNHLYKDIGAVNDSLATNKKAGIPDSHMTQQREDLYDGLKALMGIGSGGSLTRDYKGIMKTIGGGDKSPKDGYFQKQMLKRRQDFSARSIIIPEPHMDIDELGVPEDIAWRLYQPFIERKLIQSGWKPPDAIDEVAAKGVTARAALNRVVKDHPVLLKRDPALHKYNIMAFKPRLVKGKAIEIHPLVTSGYNADFDGDAMSLYLPITSKGVKESYKMFPSNNLFSASSGAVMYTPGHEALLGMYMISQPGKKTKKKFPSLAEARRAHTRGDIEPTDIIRVGKAETTLGRMELESVLPKFLRETGKKAVSKMRVYDKKMTRHILTRVAKTNPLIYGEVANKFKDIGNDYSYDLGFSIGLDDFATINKGTRDKMINSAEKSADNIRANKKWDKKQSDAKIAKLYEKMDEDLHAINLDYIKKNPTNISRMVMSGSRGDPLQLSQLVSGPIRVMDAKGRVVPQLIPKSYSEGMDLASYWTTMHGARKGAIQKTQGISEPGYISKQIMNSTMNQLVTNTDCGVADGVSLSVDDPDVLDRYLYKPVRIKGKTLKAGMLVTPEMKAAARKVGLRNLPVRSALRCKEEHGICQKCFGLNEDGHKHDIGTNIGVIAGQSIGEPSTQLSLNVFHTGGLAKGRGSTSQNTFGRLREIMLMPDTLPNAAPLTSTSGRVKHIEKAPQGGENIYIGDNKYYVPENQDRLVRKGQQVSKGDKLSSGHINPKTLLELKGTRAVQDHLSDELSGLLNTVGSTKRRNIEVVVKALTNVTKVEDPGDHPDLVPGDMRAHSEIRHWNAKNGRKGKPVKHTPVLKGVNVLPLEMQEDWVARLNYMNLTRTLTDAAREGWKSNIHGFHPVPSAAYAAEFGLGEKALGEKWKGQY